MWRGRWYSSTMVAMYTRGESAPVAGMRSMSRRSFREMAVLPAQDCRAQHGMALQQPSGLGRHG